MLSKRNTLQQQQEVKTSITTKNLVQFDYFSLDETPYPITCIHSLNNYLYVGCTNGRLLFYKLKKASGVTSDNGLDFEKETITLHLNASAQKNILGNVTYIETDEAMGLCFVVFEGRLAPLHIFNLDMSQLLFVDKSIVSVTAMSLDQNFENKRFVCTDGKKSNLYSYKDFHNSTTDDSKKLVLIRQLLFASEVSHMVLMDSYLITYNEQHKYTMYQLKNDKRYSTSRDDAPRIDRAVEPKFWSAFRRLKNTSIPRILPVEGKIALVRGSDNSWSPVYASADKDGFEMNYYDPISIQQIEERNSFMSDHSSTDIDDQKISPFVQLNEEFKYSVIPFSAEPRDVALCFPYVAGLVNNQVEVYSLYSNQVTIGGPLLAVRDFDDGKLICGSPERFYLVTGNSLAYMVPPSLKHQRDELYNQFLLSQAHHLFMRKFRQLKKPKNELDKEIMAMQYDAGFSMLKRAKFQQAFNFFYKAHKQSPKHRKDVRDILKFFKSYSADESRSVLIQPEFFNNFDPTENLILEGNQPLFVRLQQAINQYQITKLDIKRDGMSDEQYRQLMMQKEQDYDLIKNEALAAVLMHKGLNYLTSFLEKIRTSNTKNKKEQYEQAAIEYMLIALYIRRLDSDPHANSRIEAIVDDNNSCSFDPVLKAKFIALLKDAKCYRHLALLIKSGANGDLAEYLNALNNLRQNVKDDRFYELYDGVDDAVEILCKISGEDLMKEEVKSYLSWCLTSSPSRSARIFTAERNLRPDPEAVLKFLNAYPHDIKQQYLHHLIVDEGSEDPKYHTLFALTLIDNIMAIIPAMQLKPSLKVQAGDENGILGKYRRLMIEHIKNSEYYNKQEVLEKLVETQRLYEELVELYKKLGRHAEALATLIYNLDDWGRAEQYCDEIYLQYYQKYEEELSLSKNKRKKNIDTGVDYSLNPYLVTLIQVCTRKPGTEAETKFVDNRIPSELQAILNRRARDIDATQALEALPEGVPISDVEHFLSQTIQFTHHRERNSLIKSKLAQNVNMQIRKTHIKAVRRNIVITPDTICPVCGQTIGNAVFSIFPDMTCVHYRCLEQSETDSKEKVRHLHPKTGVNFKKFPVDFD